MSPSRHPFGGDGDAGSRGPFFARVCICLVFFLACALACGDDEGSPPEPTDGPGGFTIRPEATWRPGPVRTDAEGNPLEWLLPNGQRITPFAATGARLLRIDYALPLGLAVHPEGGHVFVTTAGGGRQALLVVDALSGEVLHRLEADGYFLGLAFRPPRGEEVYVSGGGRDVIDAYRFNGETGELLADPDQSLRLPPSDFAGGISVSPDGRMLLAVSQAAGRLSLFDLETTQAWATVETDPNPYAVAIHPTGQEAYVSCEREGTINIFDISDPSHPTRKGAVHVEKNPEALLVNQEGTRLYVTNADEDSVSILEIGTERPRLLQTIDLRSTPGREFGSSPNALAFSKTHERLYVAQAGLNKIAVLDLVRGAHLGDIPTAWYPTAVALHTQEAEGGLAEETLCVANGKGIGMPGEGSMGHAPGAISVMPVPGDEDLGRLSRQVEANNALPGQLFEIHDGPWQNPIPPRRGGGSPIKYVFLVVRENKTYDYLLGPYQPVEGEAAGDPERVMDNHDRLLPNLYRLAERFAICDNYYSNAEASNQGHTILTASTVNSYLEKIVFAEGRRIPIELEMVFNPAVWPKKDFIFQNAMRNQVPFRDYGEAVGAGRDLLILNEDYVHFGRYDPPWFNLFSKDVQKMEERIQEWESDRYSGPDRFPRLVFMLLPNDHTFGDEAFSPTYESMVSDNDEATGVFVEWLTRSPYWMESVAFITEDDPQQGYDHIDPHRTLMLVVSPWVRRGYVSHVKYSEANLYATIEHLLDLPPMTIFDEVAQSLYDLFTFEPDEKAYEHAPREWPEEINLPGTRGSERCAGMYFAEPDQAEDLLDVHLATVAERKQAERLSNRLRERASRFRDGLHRNLFRDPVPSRATGGKSGPDEVLEVMVLQAEAGDWEGFSKLLDERSEGLLELYRQKRDLLHATNMAEDPAREAFRQFQEARPRVVAVRLEGDRADLDVVYESGVSARLKFRKEATGWKFDLSHHVSPSLRILEDTCLIERAYLAGKTLGEP